MKYFVVSDIHDHYALLIDALKNNGFDLKQKDHVLVICGDAFYSGPEPGKLFAFLNNLHKIGKLIFIYGNHDYELLDNLKGKKFGRKGNRECAKMVVEYLTGKTGLSDREIISDCERFGFTRFLENVPVPYFETEHYVFTHGFIPTEKKQYCSNWRSSTEKSWRTAASRGDGMMLSMLYGVSEPNKTIVFGHYSAARCYKMKNATQIDWENKIYKDVSDVPKEGFYPFYGDTFIAIDQSVKKTGFINCIVIDDQHNKRKNSHRCGCFLLFSLFRVALRVVQFEQVLPRSERSGM